MMEEKSKNLVWGFLVAKVKRETSVKYTTGQRNLPPHLIFIFKMFICNI